MSRSQLQRDRGNPRLKFLDRYVGIPIVLGLGLYRRVRGRRAVPRDWQAVGLVATAGIGDAVLLTGIMKDLRAARPSARIVLFVTANNASFARVLAVPDSIIELPVRRPWTALRDIRRQECDVIVDFGAWRRFDAALTALSGASAVIGRRTSGQHRHFAYDVVVDHRRDHELDNDRRLIAELGIVSTSPPILSVDRAAAPPHPHAYVVLHLWPGGANCEAREWPTDRWLQLAHRLSAQGLDIVLTGGPEDEAATRALVTSWSNDMNARCVAGSSWEVTMSWLGRARGAFSVNTGVMHVAAALGVPTIALNGPTSGSRWGPIGAYTRCVASPVVPNGYLNLGFERDERFEDCMSAITVEAVLEAWDDINAEVEVAPESL